MINNQIVKVYIKPNNTIVINEYFVYKRKLILCRDFRNDDNVEKLTTVGGKLFQMWQNSPQNVRGGIFFSQCAIGGVHAVRDPRRADVGHGPGGASSDVGHTAGGAARSDDDPVDALHGRGRPARRPHRHTRQRTTPVLRHFHVPQEEIRYTAAAAAEKIAVHDPRGHFVASFPHFSRNRFRVYVSVRPVPLRCGKVA